LTSRKTLKRVFDYSLIVEKERKLTEFLGLKEDSIDWTGIQEDTRYFTHGLHPYPARMPPHISRRLIRMYSKNQEDLVLDPFCGSGGVLVEAMLYDRMAIGVDLNPLAVLIAKVKTTPLNPETLYKVKYKLLEGAAQRLKSSNYKVPNIKNLDYWFKPEAVAGLAAIKEELEELSLMEEVADFFRVCFSLTVRETSNLRKGEFKLYRRSVAELEKFKPDPLKTFSEIVSENIQRMADFYFEMLKHPKGKARVFKGDTRNLLELGVVDKGSVDLVVTSPPYGDSHTTVAYGQFSRFSLLWLGFPEQEAYSVDSKSLGGRVLKKEKNLGSATLDLVLSKIDQVDQSRAKEVYSYFYDADVSLEQVAESLREGAYCCYVIANRTVRRVKVPTDQIFVELAQKYGLKHVVTFRREIPNKYIPHVNAPENVRGFKGETMTKESIVVWKA